MTVPNSGVYGPRTKVSKEYGGPDHRSINSTWILVLIYLRYTFEYEPPDFSNDWARLDRESPLHEGFESDVVDYTDLQMIEFQSQWKQDWMPTLEVGG